MAGIDELFRRKKKPGPKPKEVEEEKQQLNPILESRLDDLIIGVREWYLDKMGEEIDERTLAAHIMSKGYPVKVTARKIGVTDRTIYRWKHDLDFMELLDSITMRSGNSTKAERIRKANEYEMEVVDYRRMNGKPASNKDPMDILEYVRKEMEGARLLSDEEIDKLAAAFTGSGDQEAATGRPGETEGEAATDGTESEE